MKAATLEAARAAKGKAASALRGVGEIVGVGLVTIGEGYGIKVNLAAAPKNLSSAPTHVNGVPVHFEVVGAITKGG